MDEFITDNRINLVLEEMIKSANEYLYLISPYIKLHDRLKAELKSKLTEHSLAITVVFGKNEGDAEKSVKKEDIDFFMQFPNIKICYEKNLHAKFYASEDCSMLTSMNLHQFSQNTNIEAAILMYPKKSLEQLANVLVTTQSIDEDAIKYFEQLIERSDEIYVSQPQYKKDFLGITKKYTHSEIVTNKIDHFFTKKANNSFGNMSTTKKFAYNRTDFFEDEPPYNQPSHQQNYDQHRDRNTAFCIRTGRAIPFNMKMPYCPEAFNTWSQFRNPDYAEAYCHSTGKPSGGRTSMRSPVLRG